MEERGRRVSLTAGPSTQLLTRFLPAVHTRSDQEPVKTIKADVHASITTRGTGKAAQRGAVTQIMGLSRKRQRQKRQRG